MTANEQVPDYLRTHALRGDVMHLRLASETESLRQQIQQRGLERAAKTLVKQGPISVTLVALCRGASLEEHQVEGPVTILILDGRFRLSAGGKDTEASSGEILALDAGVRHRGHAVEDTVFLLTVALES